SSIMDYYASVAIPALFLAEHDRGRGVLDAPRRNRVVQSMILLGENLSDHQDPEEVEDESAEEKARKKIPDKKTAKVEEPKIIISAGGRGDLDDAEAGVFGDTPQRQGVKFP